MFRRTRIDAEETDGDGYLLLEEEEGRNRTRINTEEVAYSA
jgi:hypothetical protein